MIFPGAVVTWNWDVNLGSVLTLVGIAAGIWRAHQSTRREAVKMHQENKTQIAAMQAQMQLIVQWMQSQWRGSGGD